MSQRYTLWSDNDTLLQVGTSADPFTDRADGSVVSGASVVATISESSGPVVSGATGITLPESTTIGVYQGTVPSTAGVLAGRGYNIDVTASTTDGRDASWSLSARGRERYR